MDPSPPLPADVDLRDFSFMPLDVSRLRDSGLAAHPDADIFRSNVLSWCVSWHQVPAASLPDDDAELAWLLGYGRDLRGWKKVRAKGGLRGWIRCSDGRLYHPVVVEKAIEAWAKRKTYSRNGSKGAAKRWGETDSQAIPADSKSHGLTIDLPMAKNSKGQRQGEVRDKEAPATPITQSNSEKPSPVGAPVVRKMNGDGDGEGGGRFGGELNAENRIQFAIQKALPFLPGRDDSDRWIVAQAAEDPKDPNHAKAVTAMLKATKQARVGWISPERRTVTGKTRNNLGKATKHTVSYAGS